MGASQSTIELRAENKFVQYKARLGEMALISDYRTRLERLEELISELRSETNVLNSDEGSKLSKETRESLKYRCNFFIQECRDIARFYELIIELSKMKAQRDEAPFEKQITTARGELEELKSNLIIGSYHKRDLIPKFQTELQRLYKEVIDQVLPHVSPEILASLQELYLTNVEQCKDIVRYYVLITELAKLKAPIYKIHVAPFERQITTAKKELKELKSNPTIDSYHKQNLIQIFQRELKRLDKEYTDQFLNVEIRDSIDLIEKTLEEPYLYSLPHLIMWRDTAREKIQKIKKFPLPIPQELAQQLIEKYGSLYKKLRAEILKLRTYPIPEPWRSHCMRQEVTHLIKGEFIFFVHPGIEEDMRPLTLSERDILPGGLTRQVYDSRMDRMNMESRVASEKLIACHVRDINTKLKWSEDWFPEIEKDVNFAFEELPLLHRDGRSLDYLVNKNEDDALLKEIYDILLRRIRHFYNNRIDIPSFALDYAREPILVAPPKSERNIPIASGVDRGATEGLQLVTPASVLVVDKTVFVADKCGHLVTGYRDSDLEAVGWNHLETADTPVSLTVFKGSLFACYANQFVKYRLSWNVKLHVQRIQFETSIEITQICCTASYHSYWMCDISCLYVGTFKPSLIHIDTDTLRIKREYPLHPIRYSNKNRYPWLQDMKATDNSIFCLFSGSPSPLQEFSFQGELLRSILTEDQIVGAYHFYLFKNPVTTEWFIYITDFWNSAIKVFDLAGRFKETFSEKGFELGQIFHPTGIFVERSGLITVCDMKEENCLQRL